LFLYSPFIYLLLLQYRLIILLFDRAGKRYDSSTFTKKFTFLEGDIALLEDYTYAIFKKQQYLKVIVPI